MAIIMRHTARGCSRSVLASAPSLVIVIRDAYSVLVHAHDAGTDHLHRRIMTGGQRIHDPVRDANAGP
jgi:hypothetical protein